MWWTYSDAKEQKAQLQREIEKRKMRGEVMEAMEAPKGNKLAKNFWGQAWQRHMEGYADYESRLPRGRTYLRQGNVFNVLIEESIVTAEVAGSSLYDVEIRFAKLKPAAWDELKTACAGQVSSLIDLLSGKVGDGVLKVITDPESGLFPKPREIVINCSCPDSAGLCKHAAAVMYGIGLKFDAQPELFFKLRGVDYAELVDQAASAVAGAPADAAQNVISDDDLASVFGIEFGGALSDEAEAVLNAPVEPPKAKKKAAGKAAVKKVK